MYVAQTSVTLLMTERTTFHIEKFDSDWPEAEILHLKIDLGTLMILLAGCSCLQAVRIGDLELFRQVAEKNNPTFSVDKTQNLIVRLRHNVIRTGLRNISISYSRISLADVAAKLHLQSATAVDDAESIVTKAIRDGGIDATVDHANGWMQSKETGDIYSTQEPQTAFHSRIAFCLNTHNEAVKALTFPPDAHKKELESAEKRRERQQQEQELAKHIAEEDDEEF
jgi:26S proteasome regulatory subunit N3